MHDLVHAETAETAEATRGQISKSEAAKSDKDLLLSFVTAQFQKKKKETFAVPSGLSDGGNPCRLGGLCGLCVNEVVHRD
jgi:hypothetical protein